MESTSITTSAGLSWFSTVLVARNPLDQPSELEIQLRSEAKKVRVVTKLSGGAHLLFPGSETTIAVRAYYPDQVNHLELEPSNTDLVEAWNRGKIPMRGNMDGLKIFRDAFKYPVVFFIIPPSPLMKKQLSRADSFFNLSQLIMNDAERVERNPKTFLVPHTRSVIDTIVTMLDALHPERRKLRDSYYMHTRAMNFLPDARGQIDQNSISSQVANRIRHLSTRLGFAPGEAEILMNNLGSLYKVAIADYQALRDIPIQESSKNRLREFFGSQKDQSENSCMAWHNYETEELNQAFVSGVSESYQYQDDEVRSTVGHLPQQHRSQTLPMEGMTYQPRFAPNETYENYHSNYARLGVDRPLYGSIPILEETDQICGRSLRNDAVFDSVGDFYSNNVQSSYGYPQLY